MKKAMKTEGCLQAKLLKTSGGFHTSLMLPAKEKLLKALKTKQTHKTNNNTNKQTNIQPKQSQANKTQTYTEAPPGPPRRGEGHEAAQVRRLHEQNKQTNKKHINTHKTNQP